MCVSVEGSKKCQTNPNLDSCITLDALRQLDMVLPAIGPQLQQSTFSPIDCHHKSDNCNRKSANNVNYYSLMIFLIPKLSQRITLCVRWYPNVKMPSGTMHVKQDRHS